MIEQPLQLPRNEREQVPKPVNLHQICIIIGEDKFRIGLEEKIGNVVQFNESIQLVRGDAVLLAKLVTKQTRRFAGVMNQLRLAWKSLSRMMIDNQPIGLVQARFKTKVAYPRGVLPRIALAPGVVVISFEPDFDVEKFARQPLQQHPGQQSDEPFVELTVTDNGPGISQKVLENIFLPFFTTKDKGTGLGMAISKKIVEAHDGSIDVLSEPGKGAEFVVNLPLPH